MSSECPAFEAHPVDVPPGYPREYERRLHLSDGRTVQARPIIPGDQARLREAFLTADAETLYRRFLGNPPHLTAERLTHWCTVDYRHRFALVACAPATGESVAVARYEPMDEGVAEVAVVVDPRWRQIGVATALVEMLAEAALGRGIHSFTASYLAGNQPVAALTRLAGGVRNPSVWRGVAEVAVQLERDRPHHGRSSVAERTQSTRSGSGCAANWPGEAPPVRAAAHPSRALKHEMTSGFQLSSDRGSRTTTAVSVDRRRA